MALQMRKIAQRSWIMTLRVMALLLILLAIALGLLLGTEAGRVSVAHQGVTLYSLYSGEQIKVGGISTASPGQWSFRSLNWAAQNSPLSVSVQKLDLKWNWRFAMKNRWWIPEVTIDRLEVTLAESEATESNGLQGFARLWQSLPAIRLEQLLVNQLIVNRPNYPSLSVALNAQADINWGVVPARFIVSMTDLTSANELALQLNAEGVDQFRALGALGAQAHSAWSKWLNWELDQDLTAHWDLLADYSTENRLALVVSESSLPWQEHQLDANGRVDYLIQERQFNFNQLSLHLDGKPALINGWINRFESDLNINVDHWNLMPLLRYLKVESAQGDIDGELQWYGGWRTPRINGQVTTKGEWRGIPVASTFVSEATTSGVRIEKADVIAGINNLSLQGTVDWRDDLVALTYKTNIKRGPFINSLLENLPSSVDFKGDLDGTISGKVYEPIIEYTGKTQLTYLGENYQAALSGRVDPNTLVIDRYALFGDLAHFSGQGQFEFDSKQWQSRLKVVEIDSQLLDLISVQLPVDWHAVLSGDFSAKSNKGRVNVEGTANLQGEYQQEPMNAQLEISQLNGQSITLSKAMIRIGSSFVQGKGTANWSEPSWDFELDHRDLSVALIRPWVTQWPEILSSLSMTLTGRSQLTNVWFEPIIETASDIRGEWFGKDITGQIALSPNSLNDWQLNIDDLHWYGATIDYVGQLDAYNLTVNGDASIQEWPLDRFVLFNQEVLDRAVAIPHYLDGSLSAALSLKGGLINYELNGDLTFDGSYQQQPLSTEVIITSLTNRGITLEQLSSQWGENNASLAGYYHWLDQRYLIELNAQVNEVEPIAELLTPFVINEHVQASLQNWTGQLETRLLAKNEQGDAYIEGELDSQGQWYGTNYQVQWQGKGSWLDVLNQTLNAQWGESRLIANVDLNDEQLSGGISLNNLSASQLKRLFPSAPEALTGNIDSQIDVSGPLTSPRLSISGNGRGAMTTQEKSHLWKANLVGEWAKSEWALTKGHIAVEGGGQIDITANGQGSVGTVSLLADIPQTNYWIADSELGPGRSTIEFMMQGDLLNPTIEMDAAWHAEIWPISVSSKIRTTGEAVHLTGAILSGGLNRIKMNATLPRRSWNDWQAHWHEIPFGFDVAIHTPLSDLDPFFVDRPNQSVSGLIAGQYNFYGSFDSPNWQGKVEWSDGKFENVSSGTLLNDIDLTLIAKKSSLTLIGFANDGRDGLLEVNGGIEFDPQPRDIFKHDFNVIFKAFNANMISDSQIDATMTGGVSVTGQYHNLLVAGSFDVSPLNLQTETFLLDGVPQLNIVQAIEEDTITEAPRPVYWPSGQWDVGLTASKRANLYGQGISAELAGSLELQGEFSEPTIAGRFNVIRGTYSALGKVFSVTGGSVQIQNNQLVFNVEASYNELGLNVLLKIAGTQDELTLQLQSVPALDQNELLAQLVFGKSIENISEFQAIQLAYLVNNIRTGTTSFDIIGATRQELTLDSLIIDPQTDEEGNLGVNVRAGKYLNNFLYLEVEQNVGADDGLRSSLQLQVTPNTYLELFAEESLGTGGAELKWSIDY